MLQNTRKALLNFMRLILRRKTDFDICPFHSYDKKGCFHQLNTLPQDDTIQSCQEKITF